MNKTIEEVFLEGLEALMVQAAFKRGVGLTPEYLVNAKFNTLDNFDSVDLLLCGYCLGAGYTFEDYYNIEPPLESMYDKLIEQYQEV